MSEAEKQEGQKTVVAFITGLLIGGLLVWVFSSSPESANAPVDTEDDTTTEKVEGAKDTSNSTPDTSVGVKGGDTAAVITKPKEVAGEGMLKVDDQKSGMTVELNETAFPTSNGWVVVRDYMDGTPGRVLGAARYSVETGLTPTAVSLLRETTPGSSYQVVYYTDDGDKEFSLSKDTLIEDIAATFKAK